MLRPIRDPIRIYTVLINLINLSVHRMFRHSPGGITVKFKVRDPNNCYIRCTLYHAALGIVTLARMHSASQSPLKSRVRHQR